MYRSRANLGRKRGHRAPAIRPGGTLGLSEAADSEARLFQDSTGRSLSCFLMPVSPSGSRAREGCCGLAVCAESPLWALSEPRASRVPSSDEEVAEEPQNRRTRMSLGTKGLKVNLFPGLSPSALKVPSDHSAGTSSQLATLRPACLLSVRSSVRPSLPWPLLPIPPAILLSLLAPVLRAECGGRKHRAFVFQNFPGCGRHKPWP